MPAVADLELAERGVAARLLELDELLGLVDEPPAGLELGGSARIVFEVLRAARRSVAAGLVHPHLEAADGRWHALWGATLDEHVRDELAALAHAAPAAAADAFDGDTDAFVHDLYGCAVDELARRALRKVVLVPGERRAVRERRGRALPRRPRRSQPEPPRPQRLPGPRATAEHLGRRGAVAPLARAVEPRPPAGRGGVRGRRGAAGRPRALARGGGRPDARTPGQPPARRQRRRVRVPPRERPPPRARAAPAADRADPRLGRDRARGRSAERRRARRRAGRSVPARGDATARAARRPGAAAPRVGRQRRAASRSTSSRPTRRRCRAACSPPTRSPPSTGGSRSGTWS